MKNNVSRLLYRVLTIPGQTHGEAEERIMRPHTPVHTPAPPYLIVVAEKAMRAM